MSDPQTPELNAEAQSVIRKARVFFLFTIGVLVIGFFVVMVAVFMRSSSNAPSTGNEYALAAVKIPAGAEVLSAVAADGKLSVTYRAGTVTSVRIFDGKTGEMVREIPVISE